jgi:hypothetical protein
METQRRELGTEDTDSADHADTSTVSVYRFPARSPQAGAEMALLRSQFRGGAER